MIDKAILKKLPIGQRPRRAEDDERLKQALEQGTLPGDTGWRCRNLLGHDGKSLLTQEEVGWCLAQEIEAERLLARLTNWQRNQWQRDGSPKDLVSLRRFAGMRGNGREIGPQSLVVKP